MKDDRLISLKDAVETVKAITVYCELQLNGGDMRLPVVSPVDVLNALEKLPSVQPRWIPCSKKMPKEHEWIGTKKYGTTISNEVYVTFETPDGERFAKHISFQNEKLSPADEQRMNVWYKGAKPIAWMPLPKPWEGGQDD